MDQALGMAFAGSSRDRFHALRGDQAAQEALWASGEVLPLWRGQPLFGPDGLAYLPQGHAALIGQEPAVFLGMRGGKGLFAQDISQWQPEEGIPHDQSAGLSHPALSSEYVFKELRQMMAGLSVEEGEIAATARAMCEWHRSHAFCARCGTRSLAGGGGWHRQCPSCTAQHFPRTDPCVIMVVTRGDQLLLGRSPGWPQGMYSLLAGFIEPGETMEAAVIREVMEETGVQCQNVCYLASQPWPFPASLMLGCWAEATSAEIVIDPAELDHAFWASYQEVREIIAGTHPQVSPPRQGSIARKLIVDWLSSLEK